MSRGPHTIECTCNCDNGYPCDIKAHRFGDALTTHRRLRAMALAVVEPLHRAIAEVEWQITRLDTWLRDEQS